MDYPPCAWNTDVLNEYVQSDSLTLSACGGHITSVQGGVGERIRGHRRKNLFPGLYATGSRRQGFGISFGISS